MSRLSCGLVLIVLVVVGIGGVSTARAGEVEDAMRRRLASPAEIVQRADDLRLSLEQRDDLIDLGTRYQAEVRRLEADILDASARIARLLDADKVDREQVLAELDRAAQAESRIKHIHLDLWLRANALLTTSQRRHLLQWLADDRAKKAPQTP